MGRPVPAAAATLRRLVWGLAMMDLKALPFGTALTILPEQAVNGRAESCIAILEEVSLQDESMQLVLAAGKAE